MLRVMLRKCWAKRWMVLCLVLGSILLIATVVSFPMYRNAAFDRMLKDEFHNYLTEYGEWPAMQEMIIISKKEKDGATMKRMESLLDGIYDQLGVTEKNTIEYYSLAKVGAKSLMKNTEELYLRLAYMTDLPEYAQMISGEMYSEDGLAEDGSIEVVISQQCMVTSDLLIGETIEFDALKGADGKKIRMKIVGVFEEADSKDFYWQVSPDTMDNVCLMNEKLFREYFTGANAAKYTITCSYYSLFEYEDIQAANAAHMMKEIKYLTEESPYRSVISQPAYMNILESFSGKQNKIEATLFILQVPVLILLAAFLFMISGQMYDMERNEISVIKSRGSSSGQVFRLYLYQSIFLTLIGLVGGLPLGTLFSRILGSAENFLEFDITRELNIRITTDVCQYAAVAAGICVLIMTLPALKHSRLSIVKLKQQNALKRKSLWEKLFLDAICLGISLYGFYSFSKNKDAMVQSVLQGESLDPLLYISSSLFIVGAGLLFLRLQPLLIGLVYNLGKKAWKPASYASFMENIKNGRKQQFIMLFMILTISLGMYHATVARTILANAKQNAEYLQGADMIIQEKWTDNSSFAAQSQGDITLQYDEPDYSKYASLKSAKSYTKVIFDDRAYLKDKSDTIPVTLMGIHTREFGENTYVSESLLDKHYYEYLNELAVVSNGVLVSRNYETIMGYKVGDTITVYNKDNKYITLKILDFFDYWPGYAPTSLGLNPDGSVSRSENYQMVANISTLTQKWGVTPYEVWFTLKDDADTDEVYQWVQDNNVTVRKYVDKAAEVQKVVEDPLLQGTNGVLTMGFIVTIILCAVGYLIYWIMSIRSREMMFGVLRACGMHKGELFHMLMNEQIFSGVLSIFAGIGIGKLTSKMFVPMLQTAYAAANQVLPMELITNQMDMIRLYCVIAGVMAVCLAVLILLVFKLNVTKALKLGEE